MTLGLAPSAGLALLAVAATWMRALGLPLLLTALVAVVLGCSGIVLMGRDWRSMRRDCHHGPVDQVAILGLACAILVPLLLLESAFAGVTVPVSTSDGAHHAEAIDLLRRGLAWISWYPPGFHTITAAMLTLSPWLDSAEGTLQISFSLASLATLAVFGLGLAIWSSPRTASLAALFAALTFHFLYFPHLLDLWPMAMASVMVLGLWTTCIRYVEEPTYQLALLGGVLASGIVVTHGTELATVLLGVAVIVALQWRNLRWVGLGKHVLLATATGAILAAPYLPSIVAWTRSGGAVAVADQHTGSLEMLTGVRGDLSTLWAVAVGGHAIDLHLRLILLTAGFASAMRRRSTAVLAGLLLVFVAVVATFVYSEHPLVRWVYTRTFPWSYPARLVSIPSVLAAMLEAYGVVVIVHAVGRLGSVTATRIPRRLISSRALRRIALVIGLVLAVAQGIVLTRVVSSIGHDSITYTNDDSSAMTWLREHAEPGATIANDYAADGGVWAPFKAGIPVLAPRLMGRPVPSDREVILENVATLGAAPEAAAAACRLGVRYVYRGAAGTRYESRSFPPVAVLRASSTLEEVFASGEAVVFRTRLPCSDTTPSSRSMTHAASSAAFITRRVTTRIGDLTACGLRPRGSAGCHGYTENGVQTVAMAASARGPSRRRAFGMSRAGPRRTPRGIPSVSRR
jgi:hypothetical protein